MTDLSTQLKALMDSPGPNGLVFDLGTFVLANAPAILSLLDEDWLEEAISDSLEMDWRPRDAAKAILRRIESPIP